MSVRIVLVDDHRIVQEGLRTLLEQQPGMDVVAQAYDGPAAIDLVALHKPDLVIMDLTMPGMSGIEAARQILATQPQMKIIALSMHSDKRFVREILTVGAVGYLLKDCALEELAHAIQTVQAGQIYISPGIASVMIGDYLKQTDGSDPEGSRLLTSKEREVVQLIAAGLSTKVIAGRMAVSIKTVETHRQHVMEKLGIHSVAELVKYAIREGLTSLE